MRWAFWRGREHSGQRAPQDDRPLPEDMGLPKADRGRPRPGGPDEDEDARHAAAAAPFSGASPATVPRPREGGASPAPEPSAALDEAHLVGSGPVVVRLVRAVLDDSAGAVHAAVPSSEDPARAPTATAAAVAALSARLPALSGVDGAVTFDEDEADLLHAYADLLAERAEQRRAALTPDVSREHLTVVAHLAAAAALGDPAADPSLLVLDGIPPSEQLLAACVLLAQTSADGGGDAEGLAGEIAELFG